MFDMAAQNSNPSCLSQDAKALAIAPLCYYKCKLIGTWQTWTDRTVGWEKNKGSTYDNLFGDLVSASRVWWLVEHKVKQTWLWLQEHAARNNGDTHLHNNDMCISIIVTLIAYSITTAPCDELIATQLSQLRVEKGSHKIMCVKINYEITT